jgi:hypothetical protein
MHVPLKPPAPAAAPQQGGEAEIPETMWQAIEARWKAILDLEASLDALRISVEGLRGELEGSTKQALTPDEKVHALNADVAQWTKAKSRIQYSLPKMREFIHRSTWAAGAPERKELEEVYASHIKPRVPCPRMDKLLEKLENLMKDRQALSAHGVSVYQECKSISGDVQAALRTLRGNAAANAMRKRGTTDARSKSFKRM